LREGSRGNRGSKWNNGREEWEEWKNGMMEERNVKREELRAEKR